MARSRKPGTPGKTRIPKDIVKAVTQRLKKAFRKSDRAQVVDLSITAQQHYLYLETVEKPVEILPGLISARFAKRSAACPVPLGRMVWTGDPESWYLQLYKWSDECWDEDNDAGTDGGTPEKCLKQAIRGWGA
ncbi:MAG: hypothetical protein GXY44_09130 [Phycisphaerales bacterium]|nr:hypothetical protein [Phycisphaerales bacterium]